MNFSFEPMTIEVAKKVIAWNYEGDYSLYNFPNEDIEDEIAYLADPKNHYFAMYQQDDFVAYALFYREGQVSGGDYSTDALDIGAGMRPDDTGQGKGAKVIAAILDFGREQYTPKAFRATIAA